MSVPILLYHHIDAPPPRGVPGRSLWVSPARFAAQMRLLRRLGYRGMSLAAAAPYITGEKQGKAAVITFDDGALSVYNNALPALESLGFTATCFFVADCAGGSNAWDKPPHQSAPLMGRAEMRGWLARGQEAGGHTLSHAHLPALPQAEAEREIAGCKQKLEAELGAELVSFAYPYGEESAAVQALARKAGWRYGVTTQRGQAQSGGNMLALPRHSIRRNDSLAHFLAKILLRKKG